MDFKTIDKSNYRECMELQVEESQKHFVADNTRSLVEAAVPFAGQAEHWGAAQRQRYEALLARCDTVTVLQGHYSPGCMMKRNRYMVDHADLIIACYDGKSGGTLNTLRYAIERDIQIVHLALENE